MAPWFGLAAATRQAGHEVEMLDLVGAKDPESYIRETILSFQPDLIGVSVRNIDDQKMGKPIFLLEQAKEVVEICKAVSDAPIVLGGAGYSMFPESVLEDLTLIWEYRARAKWRFRPSWNGSSEGPTCQACPAYIYRAAASKGTVSL